MLAYGKIVMNTESHEVTYDGKKVDLNPKEYQLLKLFLEYPHHILTHDLIISQIWSSDQFPTDSTIRSHVKMLRKSLKESGEANSIIQTVRGFGYRLNPTQKHKTKENAIPFPNISTLKTFFHAKAIEYLSINQQHIIKFFSPRLLNYCDYPKQLKIGSYLGDAFPEFIGYEEDFEKVRNKGEEVFELKGIGRSINPQRPEYLNFYVLANNLNNSISSREQLLFVFFEDDSEKMILRQQLLQEANETLLILEVEKCKFNEQKRAD